MLDLQQHKEFLWKYMVSYGKLEKKPDTDSYVFPFLDIQMEAQHTLEDYKNEDLKDRIFHCESILDIYNIISLEYKAFYFMEICSLIRDETNLYSTLLKQTYQLCKDTGYITQKNYLYLAQFANDEVKTFITNALSA